MVLTFIPLKDITNIDKIFNYSNSHFYVSWNEEYLKSLVGKYKDKVVAFSIDRNNDSYTVLLKGVIKYFLFVFDMKRTWLRRIRDDDMRQVAFENMLVVDEDQFSRFKKVLLVNNLNQKP